MIDYAPDRAATTADGVSTLPDPDNDRALLSRFVTDRDEAAFAELVRRHGQMVRATCRRFLGDTPDADDAFQAVFVILARKANSVQRGTLLGPWLHTVAVRAASRARATTRRRLSFERPVTAMPEPALTPADPPSDWLPLLHEELEHLPAKYREPLVLCELQGRSRAEAAEALDIPEGTLSSRLARGRALLRRRLARRGVAAAMLAGLFVTPAPATEPVPARLVESTTRAAVAGAVSAPVAALTEGVLRTMFLAKLKTWAVVCVAITGLAATAPLLLWAADTAKGKADREMIQGTWKVSSHLKNGKQTDGNDDNLEVKQIVFEGDKLTTDSGIVAECKLDPKQNPKHIDVIAKEGPVPDKGKVAPGIYEIKGDELRICFGVPGVDRPTEFTADAGSMCVMIVLKRVKK
jgi:RNA polymerase sigma factor (sigma-70 family)